MKVFLFRVLLVLFIVSIAAIPFKCERLYASPIPKSKNWKKYSKTTRKRLKGNRPGCFKRNNGYFVPQYDWFQ